MHIQELWDELDPRDKDVLLNKSGLDPEITLKDWRILTDKERKDIVDWCYRIWTTPIKIPGCLFIWTNKSTLTTYTIY